MAAHRSSSEIHIIRPPVVGLGAVFCKSRRPFLDATVVSGGRGQFSARQCTSCSAATM